jgi:hypothetical protein
MRNGLLRRAVAYVCREPAELDGAQQTEAAYWRPHGRRGFGPGMGLHIPAARNERGLACSASIAKESMG